MQLFRTELVNTTSGQQFDSLKHSAECEEMCFEIAKMRIQLFVVRSVFFFHRIEVTISYYSDYSQLPDYHFPFLKSNKSPPMIASMNMNIAVNKLVRAVRIKSLSS